MYYLTSQINIQAILRLHCTNLVYCSFSKGISSFNRSESTNHKQSTWQNLKSLNWTSFLRHSMSMKNVAIGWLQNSVIKITLPSGQGRGPEFWSASWLSLWYERLQNRRIFCVDHECEYGEWDWGEMHACVRLVRFARGYPRFWRFAPLQASQWKKTRLFCSLVIW